jgi:hypothetical protein
MSKMINKEEKNILNMENINNQNLDSNLDINIIIATFQEKLSNLMTELVIKEATIKQQANLIKRLKGQNYE